MLGRSPWSLARRRPAPGPERRGRPSLVAAAAASTAGAAAGQVVVPASTFEDAGEWLAERAVSLAEARGRRVVVGITGPPGGGKSTLAALVCERADALLRRRQGRREGTTEDGGGVDGGNKDDHDASPQTTTALAALLPMDGFHYTRAQLDAFPDPAAAHARRGAPFTFDAEAFVAAVAAAAAAPREPPPSASPPLLLVPTFDHATKDPVPGGIRIEPEARVVIVEGNYLLLDEEPWSRLWRGGEEEEGAGDGERQDGGGGTHPPPLLDECWFVDAPLEAAMAHVFARQTREMGLSQEESRRRVEENDAPNARAVLATQKRASVLVPGELPMAAAPAAEA